MFDHVGLRVKNLEAALGLYEAMLAPLGHVAGARGESYAGLGPEGAPARFGFIWTPKAVARTLRCARRPAKR